MLIFSLLAVVGSLFFLYIGESKPAPWNTTGFIGELRKQYRGLRFLFWLGFAMLAMILPSILSWYW